MEKEWVLPVPRATAEQKAHLLSYMEKRPLLAQKEYGTADGRVEALKEWKTLADTLNALPRGSQKTAAQWMKYSNDQWQAAKTRAAAVRNHLAQTGGANPLDILTDYDRRMIAVMGGWKRIVGFTSIIDPLEITNPIGPGIAPGHTIDFRRRRWNTCPRPDACCNCPTIRNKATDSRSSSQPTLTSTDIDNDGWEKIPEFLLNPSINNELVDSRSSSQPTLTSPDIDNDGWEKNSRSSSQLTMISPDIDNDGWEKLPEFLLNPAINNELVDSRSSSQLTMISPDIDNDGCEEVPEFLPNLSINNELADSRSSSQLTMISPDIDNDRCEEVPEFLPNLSFNYELKVPTRSSAPVTVFRKSVASSAEGSSGGLSLVITSGCQPRSQPNGPPLNSDCPKGNRGVIFAQKDTPSVNIMPCTGSDHEALKAHSQVNPKSLAPLGVQVKPIVSIEYSNES